MRTYITTLLMVGLTLLVYHDVVDWSVAIANAVIIWYWALFYNRYDYLPLLGMVGTLVGLILAFTTIDVHHLSDADMVKAMVGSVISGIGLAITTTLTAVVLWLAEDWNHARD